MQKRYSAFSYGRLCSLYVATATWLIVSYAAFASAAGRDRGELNVNFKAKLRSEVDVDARWGSVESRSASYGKHRDHDYHDIVRKSLLLDARNAIRKQGVHTASERRDGHLEGGLGVTLTGRKLSQATEIQRRYATVSRRQGGDGGTMAFITKQQVNSILQTCPTTNVLQAREQAKEKSLMDLYRGGGNSVSDSNTGLDAIYSVPPSGGLVISIPPPSPNLDTKSATSENSASASASASSSSSSVASPP